MAGFERGTTRQFRGAESDTEEFRRCMNEWVIFLDGEMRTAKDEIRRLRGRIMLLESELDAVWRR